MILVSLGTHQQSFPRALDLVEPLATAGNEILIQHGSTAPRPDVPNTLWVESMPFDGLVHAMNEADSVICHAGVGTIMTALKAGHKPVVIPRQPGLGEHVDAHQMDIASRLHEYGLITCVSDATELAPLLTRRQEGQGQRIGEVGDELRDAVLRAVASGPRRGRLSLRLR